MHGVINIDFQFYIPGFIWNWMLGKGFNVMFPKMIEGFKKRDQEMAKKEK